jgi:hypothetical protein
MFTKKKQGELVKRLISVWYSIAFLSSEVAYSQYESNSPDRHPDA